MKIRFPTDAVCWRGTSSCASSSFHYLSVFLQGGRLQGFKMLQFSGSMSLSNQSPSLAAAFSRARAISLSSTDQALPQVLGSSRTNKPGLKCFWCCLFHICRENKPSPAFTVVQSEHLQVTVLQELFLSLHLLHRGLEKPPAPKLWGFHLGSFEAHRTQIFWKHSSINSPLQQIKAESSPDCLKTGWVSISMQSALVEHPGQSSWGVQRRGVSQFQLLGNYQLRRRF